MTDDEIIEMFAKAHAGETVRRAVADVRKGAKAFAAMGAASGQAAHSLRMFADAVRRTSVPPIP